MFGYIYITNNLSNGRAYVGQRHGDFTPRYLGSGLILRDAINLYGKDRFETNILEECDNQHDLDQSEIDWISIVRGIGGNLYNIHPGGHGYKHGPNHPNFGKKRSPESIEKGASKQRGIAQPKDAVLARAKMLLGRKMPESMKKHLSLALKGRGAGIPRGAPSMETRLRMSEAAKIRCKRDIIKIDKSNA